MIDPGSFEQRIRACYGAAYARVARIVGRAEVAEDVLQEALVKAWLSRGQLRDEERLEGWFLVIATREAVAASRSMARARARHAPHDEAYLVDGRPDPSRAAEAVEQADLVWQAMEGLSPRQRAVFAMCGVEGLELREAAASLGITTGSAKRHLGRARQRLRRALATSMEDP